MSQLVMRSFDVADKGEPNKGEDPLGRRGERTPDHNHHSKGEKKWKKRKEWKKKMRKCGWRQEAATRQDIKGSSYGCIEESWIQCQRRGPVCSYESRLVAHEAVKRLNFHVMKEAGSFSKLPYCRAHRRLLAAELANIWLSPRLA